MTTIVSKPLGTDGFELCQPVAKEDFALIHALINGEPRKPEWNPLRMKIIRKDQGKSLRPSDSPWFGGGALIFKARAIDAVGSALREYGELLPLVCEDAEVFM